MVRASVAIAGCASIETRERNNSGVCEGRGFALTVHLIAVGRTIDGVARGLLDHHAFIATCSQLVRQADRFAFEGVFERCGEVGLWVHAVSARRLCQAVQDRGDLGAALAAGAKEGTAPDGNPNVATLTLIVVCALQKARIPCG